MQLLASQTILLTRPACQQEPLRTLFQNAGAAVLSQPTIEIRPPESWKSVDEVLARLDSFDWIVFASVNGVKFFLDRYTQVGLNFPQENESSPTRLRKNSGRRLPPLPATVDQTVFSSRKTGFPEICAIGPGTAASLASRGKSVKRIPQPHTAEGVVAALAPEAAAGKRILLVRASRGRETMYRELSAIHPAANGIEEIAVYESLDIEKPEPEIVALMESGRIDWTTCTSSAIAGSLAGMFGEKLRKTKLASISPITTETILRLGFEVAAESRRATMQGIFEAISDWF